MNYRATELTNTVVGQMIVRGLLSRFPDTGGETPVWIYNTNSATGFGTCNTNYSTQFTINIIDANSNSALVWFIQIQALLTANIPLYLNAIDIYPVSPNIYPFFILQMTSITNNNNGTYTITGVYQSSSTPHLFSQNDIIYLSYDLQGSNTNTFDQSLNTFNSVIFSGVSPYSSSSNLGSVLHPWNQMFLSSNGINFASGEAGYPNIILNSNSDNNLTISNGGFEIDYLSEAIFTVDAVSGLVQSNAETIITNTTESTSLTTGSLQVDGGSAIAKSLWLGGTLQLEYMDFPTNNFVINSDRSLGQVMKTYVDTYSIYSTSYPEPTPVFTISNTGSVGIFTPNYAVGIGAVEINGSSDGSLIAPTQSGVMLHITGPPASRSTIDNDAFGNYATFVGRRADGTPSAPIALGSGEIITRFSGNPYIGSGFAPIGTASMEFATTESQSGTNQGSKINFYTTQIGHSTTIPIFSVDSNGITIVNNSLGSGIIFADATKQITAGIAVNLLGVSNGVATLDGSGKVPAGQLPTGAVTYIGPWNASSNTPTLNNSSGIYNIPGYEFSVSVGGTVNFGAGPIVFNQGDFVIYTSADIWTNIPGNTNVVTTFNGVSGSITYGYTQIIAGLGFTPYNSTNPAGYITAAQVPTYALTSFNGRTGPAITLTTADVTGVLIVGGVGQVTGSMISNSTVSNSNLINNSITIGSSTPTTLGSSISTVTGLVSLSSTTILSSTITNTGTVGTANLTASGTITNSSLTASQAVVTDASKNLISLAYVSTTPASGGTSNIVARDSNGNTAMNNYTSTTLSISNGTAQVLTVASSRIIFLNGGGPPVAPSIKLPDPNTLTVGWVFEINNNSGYTVVVSGSNSSLVCNMLAGSYCYLILQVVSSNQWDVHWGLPTSAAYGNAGLTVTGTIAASTKLSCSTFQMTTGAANTNVLQSDASGNGTWATLSSIKSFVIDHPVDKEKYLVHTCLEGPEVGVYYRGKGEITNNDSITIQLPKYVKNLATNFTIHITPIYNGKNRNNNYFPSEVENNEFSVYGDNGKFYWIVYGERGFVEVEPYKKDVNVKGDGPYKYI